MVLRRWVAAASALIVAASLSACGNAKAAGGNNAVEKSTLNVGVLPVLGSVSYYIAKQRGFFKQEGLTVHEVSVAGAGPAMSSLLSGKLDVLSGAYESAILAASKGVKLRVIADNNSGNNDTTLVMTRGDSPIHTPAQLRGKTIGVNALNSSATMLTTIALQSHDVKPDSVKYAVVPIPQLVQSLQKKAIDAAVLLEPSITQAEQQFGANKVMDLMDGPSKNFPQSGWFSTGPFAQQNPKTVAAFHRAMVKAAKLANDRQVVEKTAPTFLPTMPKSLIGVVGMDQFQGTINSTRLQRVADDMKLVGMLKKPFNVSQMLAD